MDLEGFLNLPTSEVANLVRLDGPKVCVLPVNGTRRWFLLEHPPSSWEGKDFLNAYHDLSVKRQLDIYRLIFDHGIETLMMPMFGPDLMERGLAYQEVMMAAMCEMATDDVFTDFYHQYDVKACFYGDYRKYLKDTPFQQVCEVFEQLAERTQNHRQFRLLYGAFGHDATETVGELAIQYFQVHQKAPSKRELVEMYYGENIPPVSFFIGFDRFSSFDMPLVATGAEDLYFTASPSFYLNQTQLRIILYDHLYTRRIQEQDYEELTPEVIGRMRDFYSQNQNNTLGVGMVRDGFWYPLPNVILPDSFKI